MTIRERMVGLLRRHKLTEEEIKTTLTKFIKKNEDIERHFDNDIMPYSPGAIRVIEIAILDQATKVV